VLKGFFDEKTVSWQKNPLGIACWLSPRREDLEMHELRREGDSIALALVCIDNPCAPAPATASATTA
jgi:hypothetical protein